MESKWAIGVNGTAQFVLAQRAKAFQAHLKDFNFNEFSQISIKAKIAAEELHNLQTLADQNPDGPFAAKLKSQRKRA